MIRASQPVRSPGGPARRGLQSFPRAVALLAIVVLAIVVPPSLRADGPVVKPLQVLVTMIDDEQISGEIAGVANGQLALATQPPRSVDLNDVQRIEFGKSVADKSVGDLIWIGQDNHDLVQVGGAAGGNGVQDLHIRVTNLKALAIKQITAVCRFPSQLRVWRLDTSQSPHWRLAVARADLAPEAELYLEPASLDAFGMSFELTFTYSDNSSTKASVAATTHSSDQLKVDRAVQPGATTGANVAVAAGTAEVFLADQGRLHGEIVEITPESITLRTPWKAELKIPILQARGIWFGIPAPDGSRTDFDKQMSAPPGDDVALLLGRDKAAAQISGNVTSLSGGKLAFRFEGADRSVAVDRLLGLVFAAHPKLPATSMPYQIVSLASRDSLSGRWLAINDGQLEIETLWQGRVSIPASDVSEIRSRNGRLTFLSDLDPESVVEVAYFGRVIHWARDQGFDGGPATLKGKQAAHAIAMHSRSVLTFNLDGQFDRFKTTVGFDDSAGNRGRVIVRVLADGRELFKQDDLRSDKEPVVLETPVRGAKQLTLEVDFGEAEDVGDRVLWVDPRLFRAAAQK